jgi:hypothetical protein
MAVRQFYQAGGLHEHLVPGVCPKNGLLAYLVWEFGVEWKGVCLSNSVAVGTG